MRFSILNLIAKISNSIELDKIFLLKQRLNGKIKELKIDENGKLKTFRNENKKCVLPQNTNSTENETSDLNVSRNVNSTSNVSQKLGIKLPNVIIETYDENPELWPEFWY